MLESLSKSGEALAERVKGLEPEVARTKSGLGEAEAARLAEQEALRQRLADLRAELGALNQRYGGLDDLTQRLEAGDADLRQRIERLVGEMAELDKTIAAARAAADAAGEKAARADARAQDPRVLGVLQNRATYQSFNRSLRPEHVKALQDNWLRRLSLPATPNGLAYLADRICVLEGHLRGRLATTIEDAVLRCAVAKSIKSERVDILEIGTLFGIGGAMLHEAVRSSGREVHLTLLDPLEGYYSRDSLDIVTQHPVDEPTLRANLALAQIPKEDVTLIKAFSTDPDALAAAAERRYDMLVIDGDHSYSGVAADFRLYGPLVKVGGYILFDDYGQPDWPDVKRYVDEEMPSCDWCAMVGVEWRTAVFRVISEPPRSGAHRRRAGATVKSASTKGRARSS
jgi:cephalosporin hydroxylase